MKLQIKITFTFIFFLLLSNLFSLPVKAADYIKEAEERKELEIQSNLYDNWPLGPSIGAKAAVLMDLNSGSILYAKNIHEELFPASITKLLTTYIAVNECSLDEEITFSEQAVNSINWWEDANMGVNPGTRLPLKDVLNGILVGSANEAAYAVAEHISGDLPSFAVLMNQTAKDLGCLSSNFVTPNGIHDDNHYTTAYDMAQIARAFFSNETLCNISSTLRYEVPTNETQKKENIILTAKSQLLPGKPYAYDGLVGTKTGYTDHARQTLVSMAERNGVKLICVILMEENPYQFTDTIQLFDYGFHNFEPYFLSQMDSSYSIKNSFFTTSTDIFGNSKAILSLDEEDYFLLPNTLSLEDLTSSVSYDHSDSSVCTINYYYRSYPLGAIDVILSDHDSYIYDFSNHKINNNSISALPSEQAVFINIYHLLILVFSLIIISFLFFTLFSFLKKKHKSRKRRKHLHHRLHFGNHWDSRKY